MEEARVDFLSQIGWDFARLETMGIVSPVLSVSCDYKYPTKFSEKVSICVTVKEFKGVKLFLGYEMKNEEGRTVCSGTTSHAFLNTEGKPIRMKQEFPELFETLCNLAKEI
jgi:acyl-CoA thioester hydrolase